MIRDIYLDNVLRERWNNDSTPRTVTFYNAAGQQTSSRSYTAAEDAAAIAYEAANTAVANESVVKTNLLQDLVDVQTIIDATNATINASPASYMKILARAERRLIRAALKKYDGTT